MPLSKLFLSHHHEDVHEVQMLATELRLRGIVPWIDKGGGFEIGDHSPAQARRVLREDCFGLLFYATESAFDRPFIRDVEIDEARSIHQSNPGFLICAVPRKISFEELKELSETKFKWDLSLFHTVSIPSGADLASCLKEVSNRILLRVLHQGSGSQDDVFSLQFSTRELLPDRANDILRIDATSLLSSSPSDSNAWQQVLLALRDIKRLVSEVYGRPRLYVHGSKHLTAAFLFGRVFAPFDLDIRQTATQVWRTDQTISSISPLSASIHKYSGGQGHLLVEIASRNKNIAAGVEPFVQAQGIKVSARLQLGPPMEPLDMDNSVCLAAAKQTYQEIERVVKEEAFEKIHLFAAVPQSLMIMLGREFKGMPPVWLYEWEGTRYVFSCSVPAGVL